MENRFYRIAFDPATGAITSIRDKQLGVELVDQAAPYKFNEYLYERYESPQARTSKWYRVQSAQMSAASGPVADIADHPGLRGRGRPDHADGHALSRSQAH